MGCLAIVDEYSACEYEAVLWCDDHASISM